jgi:hypothetical protein
MLEQYEVNKGLMWGELCKKLMREMVESLINIKGKYKIIKNALFNKIIPA